MSGGPQQLLARPVLRAQAVDRLGRQPDRLYGRAALYHHQPSRSGSHEYNFTAHDGPTVHFSEKQKPGIHRRACLWPSVPQDDDAKNECPFFPRWHEQRRSVCGRRQAYSVQQRINWGLSLARRPFARRESGAEPTRGPGSVVPSIWF